MGTKLRTYCKPKIRLTCQTAVTFTFAHPFSYSWLLISGANSSSLDNITVNIVCFRRTICETRLKLVVYLVKFIKQNYPLFHDYLYCQTHICSRTIVSPGTQQLSTDSNFQMLFNIGKWSGYNGHGSAESSLDSVFFPTSNKLCRYCVPFMKCPTENLASVKDGNSNQGPFSSRTITLSGSGRLKNMTRPQGSVLM